MNGDVIEIPIEKCGIIEVGIKDATEGYLLTIYTSDEYNNSEYIVNYDHTEKQLCMYCGGEHNSDQCKKEAEKIYKKELCEVLNDVIDDDNDDMYIKVDGNIVFKK